MTNSGKAIARPTPRTRRPNTTVAPVINSNGLQANAGMGAAFRWNERSREMRPTNESSQPRTAGK